MRQIMSGGRRGVAASLLRGALAAAEGPYAGVMRLRRWMYRHALLPSRQANVPVICIGNITTGGTGKTPMVAWVVARLKEAGRKPAILTRGYRPAGGKSDEAELLKRLCDTLVVVSADRQAGADQAVAAGADVLVMDDGFQHRRLRRDMDVVLIDATNPFGYGHCLPRGLLRECPSALRDAHAIVITRSDAAAKDELDALRQQISPLAPGGSIHLAVHRPTELISPDGGRLPLRALAGKKALAFCGLGNPEAFFATIRRLGVELAAWRALDDHAQYDSATADALCDQARAAGAQVLLTTQKDAVKAPAAGFSLPMWQLVVEIEITEGGQELIQKLQTVACSRKLCVGSGI